MQDTMPQTISTLPRPQAAARKILVADDDKDLRCYLAGLLRARGYEVSEATDGVDLLGRLELELLQRPFRGFFDAIVTDVRMPGVTGTSVLHGLAAAGLAARVVVISAFADPETIQLASGLGAAAVLAKPFKTAAFLRAVEAALGHCRVDELSGSRASVLARRTKTR